MLKKIIVVTFLLIGSLLSVAGASTLDPSKPIIAILIANHSELEDSSYIGDTIIEHLTPKFQGQTTILTGSELGNKLQSKGIIDLSTVDNSKLNEALQDFGVTYILKVDVAKVEIKRGIKMGLMIKKWCAADVSSAITVTDLQTGNVLYSKNLQEKGKNEVTLGFASSSGAIKIALGKVFEQFDAEFRLQ